MTLPSTFSAYAFSVFLAQHALSLVDVAVASHVRRASVWNIQHGIAVRPENAAKVRTGLYQLTGVHYITHIDVIPDGML